MKRNILALGSLLVLIILLLVVYAQGPPTVSNFWGNVTVDGSPAINSVITAYVEVSPGEYEYRAQTTAVESEGETWYMFDVPGTSEDDGKTIALNVTPSGDTNSYLGGTGTYASWESVLVHLNASTGQPTTSCALGAACAECDNWRVREGPAGTTAECTSPGYEGCVRNSGGVTAPPYDWACCAGIITEISTF